MSRKMQRFVAAMAMAAALLLVVPAPSWAIQAHKPAAEQSRGLLAQAWAWLDSLLGQSHQAPAVQRKDILTTPAPLPPPSSQGPAIDPNGAKG